MVASLSLTNLRILVWSKSSEEAADEMGRILERVRADTTRTKSSVINVQFRSSVEDTIDLLFRD